MESDPLCTKKVGLLRLSTFTASELQEQQEATTHRRTEIEDMFTLMKEAIVLICDSTSRSEILG